MHINAPILEVRIFGRLKNGRELGQSIAFNVCELIVILCFSAVRQTVAPFRFQKYLEARNYMAQSSSVSIPLIEDSPSHLRTVIYIEDDRASTDLVEEIIGRCVDLKLLSACNGKVGAQIACDDRPDVIAMEMKLPDVNGIDLFRILRAGILTRNIPVLALSSDAYPRQIQRGLEAGFFSYFTKLFKINDFLDALDSALIVGEALRRRLRFDPTH